jgi:hypothetical protein
MWHKDGMPTLNLIGPGNPGSPLPAHLVADTTESEQMLRSDQRFGHFAD